MGPVDLSEAARRAIVLEAGSSIDRYAVEYLRHSLPPPSSETPTQTADCALQGRIRITARHCVRLVQEAGPSADSDDVLAEWAEDVEAAEAAGLVLALHTNVQNGRSFAEDASPQLQVLPELAPSIVMSVAWRMNSPQDGRTPS